jgi:hypothetical protein
MLNSLDNLQQYIQGVKRRAKCHGLAVIEVLNHLLGAVLRYCEPASLRCRTWSGRPTNVLRFTLAGTPYSLRYNHNGTIELRTPNEYGQVLRAFSNTDDRSSVERFVAQLAGANLDEV